MWQRDGSGEERRGEEITGAGWRPITYVLSWFTLRLREDGGF